jgi:hypothetical protein
MVPMQLILFLFNQINKRVFHEKEKERNHEGQEGKMGPVWGLVTVGEGKIWGRNEGGWIW